MVYYNGSQTMGHEIIDQFFKIILFVLSAVKNVMNTVCYTFKEKKNCEAILVSKGTDFRLILTSFSFHVGNFVATKYW